MWHRRLVGPTCVTSALLVAGLAGCAERPQRAGEQGTVDTAVVRATIDSLRDAYERAVAAGDMKAIGAMLADGALMVQPGGPGWDSLATAASGAPFPPRTTIDITPLEIHVLGPEWAYEFGTSTVTYTPAGAAEARKLTDTYLILFRKTAAGWKVYREVASAKPPPQVARTAP